MTTTMKIKVETVQHGFPLSVGNKSRLMESELELAEAVVFRVGLGFKSDVSNSKMHNLLNMLAYGDKKERRAARREMQKR